MTVELEVLLMRLLHGELPESQARGLQERIGREPELARAYARLARTWEGLDLPKPAPAPADFKRQVIALATGAARSPGEARFGGQPGSARPSSSKVGFARPPSDFRAGFALPSEFRAGFTRLAGDMSWSRAPLWVRSATAAALALGVVLGVGLGLRATRHEALGAGSPGIFESYLTQVNDAAATPAPSPLGGEAQQ
jgi:hypothetical protein